MCTVALLSQYEPGVVQPTDLCLGKAGKPGDKSTGLRVRLPTLECQLCL